MIMTAVPSLSEGYAQQYGAGTRVNIFHCNTQQHLRPHTMPMAEGGTGNAAHRNKGARVVSPALLLLRSAICCGAFLDSREGH